MTYPTDYVSDFAPDGRASGGVVAVVAPGSPAERAGIVPGDLIVTADGTVVRDVLDWQWYADGGTVELTVHAPSGDPRDVSMSREPDEPWGIEWVDALFDGVHRCRNACTFCFMTQLPPGMRAPLYVRDDDYRLSFLQGNFVTLTNLSDDDVERIIDQALSPLQVSVHAVSPQVRAELVCAQEDRALERIDQLLDGGIDFHVQIVLVPGVNDGEELDRTLTWLAEREGIVSVGIVPLGYTRHQDRFDGSFNDPLAAARVIEQVQRWQFESRARDGVTWVHLADEFYLNAAAPFPTTEWYDEFPQYENGIGLVRSFVDETLELRDEMLAQVALLPENESLTLVTGVMAATTLAGALQAIGAAGRVRVLAVPNRFFGGNVAVTGLLTGTDLAAAIAADAHDGAYLIPDVVLNHDGLTLDDWTFADVARQSGSDVRLVSSDAAGLLTGITYHAELTAQP